MRPAFRGAMVLVWACALIGGGAIHAGAARGAPAHGGQTNGAPANAGQANGAQANGAAAPRAPLVVIGTAGLAWSDVVAGLTPETERILLERSAALANVSHPGELGEDCGSSSWVSLGSALAASWNPAATRVIALGPGAQAAWSAATAIRSEASEESPGPTPTPPRPTTPTPTPTPTTPTPSAVRDAIDSGAALVLVDIGTGDGTALAALDRQVGLIAAAVPEARLAMVSLCDPDRREFGIGAIGAPKATPQSTQGPAVWSVPTSTTTRHDGLVTLADFAALTPADALLAASHPEPPGRSRIAALAADARHAVLAAAIAPWTYAALGIAGFAALIPLVPFARSGHLPARAAWARIWLIIGALPVATLLANLVPWWRTGPAGLTFALIAGTMAVLTCLAALALPRRLRPAGPPAVVAGVTFAAVAIDAATGNSLGWGAPLGPNLVLGRRYFGIPNVEFALLAASALVLIALALSGFRLRSVRERVAFALIAAAMGVGATVVDAAPTLGADLGGSAAIIPSFAVFAMVGLHVRFSWRRASGVVGLGGAVFAAVALVDWRRGPGAWTHAGAFVEGLLGGEGGDVIVRKALSSLMLTAVALVLAIPLGVVAVRWWRAVRHTEGVRNYRLAIPLAGACLAGLTAMVALGAVVNDSGLAGTSMGFALAGPLLLAAAPPPLP